MELLDLRQFTSADMRGLLAQESEVWAREMSWDYSSSADMILRYIDSRILPGVVAMEAGKVVGYSFFVYEGSKGVIGDLFACTGNPQRDAALREKMLLQVIATLQGTAGINRIEAQLLAHSSSSVSGPFLRGGFRAFPRLFMALELAGERFAEETVAAPETAVRNWAEQDFQPGAQLITQAYSGHIDSRINDQYRTIPGSLRFLNNIVRFPGCGFFDAESSFVALDRGGNLAGLLLCSRVRADVGHVTQICVAPHLRGRGIGERLIAECVRRLRARNFSQLSLTVTEANDRAVDLYQRLDFKTSRVFDAYVWDTTTSKPIT